MIAPEFSRPERADGIGEGERHVHIAADETERVALAHRFGLRAVDRLEGDFTLRRDAAGIVALGRIVANVVQGCVVTDDPVSVAIDEPVALRFVVENDIGGDEVELSEDVLDTVGYDGAAVDLGEAAAETMALALDPYPRGAGAAETLRRFGVISEEEAGPFGALAALKDRLGKN